MASYTDMILAGRDATPPDDMVSQARIVRLLNQVISPGDGVDAAMRARLNQRISEEWDQVQQRRKSRWSILKVNNSAYGRLAVAAGIAIVIAAVAIAISINDTSGADVSATAQGDSSALVIVILLAAAAFVAGFLYFLWNRRQ